VGALVGAPVGGLMGGPRWESPGRRALVEVLVGALVMGLMGEPW
jgi:hypothetical protein